MGKLFKNLKPYWKSVLLIVLLLVVQAFCDLSLPQYTSNIIDVGIQNKGVEHILPEQVTAEEYDTVQIFMTETEQQKWQDVYEKSGDQYRQKDSVTEKKREELDSDLLVPVHYKDKDGFALGEWIVYNRQRYLSGNLPSDRVERLEALGMVWDTGSILWEKSYAAAVQYYLENHTLEIPVKYVTPDGMALGVWLGSVARQFFCETRTEFLRKIARF